MLRSAVKRYLWACFALCASACGSNATPTKGGAVISVVLPYTGDSSSQSFNLEHAVLLAMEQVNALGGTAAGSLVFNAYDSASNLVIGYQVAAQAVADQPLAILGPQDPSLITVLVNTAQAASVLTLTASETYAITDPTLASADYWFRMNSAITPVGTALAQRAYANGNRKVAICSVDDDYGQNYKRVFGAVFQSLGGVVQAFDLEPGTPLTTADTQAPINFKPDSVFLATPPDMGADMVNSLALLASNQQYTLNGWFFAPSLESDVFSSNKIPQVAANGIGAAPQVDTTASFKQAFAKRWIGEVPVNDAYFYYDAVLYLALAIQVAQQQTGQAPTSTSIRNAMLSAAMNSGTTITADTLAQGLSLAQQGQPIIFAGVSGAVQFQTNRDRANIVPTFWAFDASGVNIVNGN